MNRIRKEIPLKIKTLRSTIYDTCVLKNNNSTLTVYQAKPSKKVLVLSTNHRSVWNQMLSRVVDEIARYIEHGFPPEDGLSRYSIIFSIWLQSTYGYYTAKIQEREFLVIITFLTYARNCKTVLQTLTRTTMMRVPKNIWMDVLINSLQNGNSAKSARAKSNKTKTCIQCKNHVCVKCVAEI